MIDYSEYTLHGKDYVLILGLTLLISTGIAYLFYRSMLAVFFLLFIYFWIKRKYQGYQTKKRKEQLNLQFKDAIQSIASALEAGYSMENSIRFAIEDVSTIYEKESYIIRELIRINSLVSNNVPIEEAIEQFAQRSYNEDIICFSEVYHSAKRSGGDLVSIMSQTSKTISQKCEVMREIKTLITAKQMEVTIMKVMPFGILIYLTIFSNQFLGPLYRNFFGICFMTIILMIYLVITWIADKIMEIEI